MRADQHFRVSYPNLFSIHILVPTVSGAVIPERPVTQAGPAHIEVLRVIDRTTHLTPRTRIRELEYHVRNNTGVNYRILYLPLPKFAVNLRIFDEDGGRLGYLPNAEVKAILAELKHEDPAAHERFEHRFKVAQYKLLVVFPVDRLLAAHSTRIITMSFENDDPVEFIGCSLFDKPRFSAKDTRYPGHPHDHFFVVVGLPEDGLRWTRRIQGNVDEKAAYVNGENGRGRILSARLPAAGDSPYTWSIDYVITPGRPRTESLLATFFWIACAAGLILLLSPWLVPLWGMEFTPASQRVGSTLAGGLAASLFAVGFNLKEHWTERYKLLLVFPFTLNAAAWFAWAFL